MNSDELQNQINEVAHGTKSARDAHENIWGEPFDGETVPVSEVSQLRADLEQARNIAEAYLWYARDRDPDATVPWSDI